MANMPKGKNKLHPTEKPLDFIKQIVTNSSHPGQTVLDPFMGSGSTGEAALNTGRKFIGIEKDDHYFEVAKNRLENLNPLERFMDG